MTTMDRDDVAAQARWWLVGLGAMVIAERSAGGHNWIVLRDPEGNQFCLTTPL
jgi:hypothetical protein